jgi:tetratricopeptide (TPR) repeat protein
MADYSSVNIPAPKDWQAFERKIRLLFEHSLNDPHTQNNGRIGQPQHGVDVYGRRGGPGGHYVGVQCKGKDANYGGAISKIELEAEVEASKDFVPSIREFVLVTTAPDDATIQEVARLLEGRVRAAGRDLSIAVWGWGRLQQEIGRFPEAIREFMPDGTPFADQQLNATEEVGKLVGKVKEIGELNTDLLQAILGRLAPPVATEASSPVNQLEKHVNDEIDSYRELARNKQPKTAITLLTALKDRVWETASPHIRFRILSNIGAAHSFLGDFEKAGDFLLEAGAFDPGDAKGMVNRVAALLMKNRKSEAHQTAVEALAKFPDDPDLALQRLLARGPSETVEAVWSLLPTLSRQKPDAHVNRIVALREENDPRWYDAAEEAIKSHPSDPRLKSLWAESIIDRTLERDPGAVGLATAIIPTQAQLIEAADVLVESWRATLNQETPPVTAIGHNAALAKVIIGDTEAAIKILDAVVAAGHNTEETKRLHVSLYRRRNMLDEAITIADTLSDTPLSRIIRADLRAKRSPCDARTILADRPSFTEERDIVSAALIVIETYCEEHNFSDALAEAERLKLLLPNHPQGPLAVYRVRQLSGDAGANAALDEAVKLVTPQTDFPTRFLVCEALDTAGKPDAIVDLLEPHTSRRIDSPALRILVAAAANADRRATLSSILKELPTELAAKSFYRKVRIALAVRVGDGAEAETQIREFLDANPKDLEMQLRLMTALYRQNKKEALAREATKSATGFTGPPELFMRLAQFKNEFGDWREAHALAYKLLLGNASNQAVNLGYIGVFLGDQKPVKFDLSPSKVDAGMAVSLVRKGGQDTVYVIEPDPALRPGPTYLSPDHGLAKLLLGHAVGDEIELPDHSKANIGWIKPKELHSLHVVLEEFNNHFPEADGLEKVRIEGTGPDSLQPVLERVRMRHDAVQNVARQYDRGLLPLALMGRLVGTDAVSAFTGLIKSGHKILVCEGTRFERDAAFKAIQDNGAKGCVVDAVTLHLIRRLNLEKAVETICGPIGIVESTALRIQEEIHQLYDGIDKPSMSIFFRDGQYYRDEATPEQKQEALAVMRADQQWLSEYAQIIPATGTKDPSADWRKMEEKFGSEFLDEIRAADGSGHMLLTDDRALRSIAASQFKVPGAWLQPVLKKAADANVVTREEYLRAILALVDANEEVVSINGLVLYASVRGASGHQLSSEFRKLASRLGGPGADGSHTAVAAEAVALGWNDRSLTETIQHAMLGELLDNLTKGRSLEEIQSIITRLAAFTDRRLRGRSIINYIDAWLRWHFISF